MRITTLLSSAALAFTGASATAIANDDVAIKDHHMEDIVDTAVAADDFNTLVAAVQTAGLVDALKGEGPFTVFAPTDMAFDALPEGTVASLLEEANRDQLTSILTYHVVSGEYLAEGTAAGTYNLPTLQGDTVEVVVGEDGSVTVDGASVVAADVKATNGVIHVIDGVIMPG